MNELEIKSRNSVIVCVIVFNYILTVIDRLSNDCQKTKTKAITPTNQATNSSMNQSQFLAITCHLPETREKSRVHGAIGFGFASHWLTNWGESSF